MTEERPELAELRARLHAIDDAGRPEAVARRRATGQRTARENLAALVDPGSFLEYGALALAAQRNRLTQTELESASPADGILCGTATIGAATFGADRARAMVLAYDYTVFAGTQGGMGHKKLDRVVAVARDQRLPVVLFAEGGGGRPNDVDMPLVAGLDTPTFRAFAGLSGLVPRIAIVSGRCFAGNAVLAGSCDVLVATANATLGMGGPAMIEGGGLGVFRPEEVGPIGMQTKNGVVDVPVADEEEAVQVTRKILGYFQGRTTEFTAADQTPLREALPERRRRAYKIRPILQTLADAGSVTELRKDFGRAIVTAFARFEGHPFGVLASDTMHLGGAIDADASDKAARFLQLCDAFGISVLSLADTPGFMVGPKAEEAALVRHASRLFVTAASLTVPFFTVFLRKGYGLGAQAMAGGHFHAGVFTAAWPSGEFGGMNLEGAVRLAMKKELAAIEDPAARQATFDAMVARAYARGKAMSMASYLEIDAVIDPAETRSFVLRGLASVPKPIPRGRRMVDTW